MGEPSILIKHEPPVEFVLILPRPTSGWPAIKQEEVKLNWWVKSVKLAKFDAKWRDNSTLFQTFMVEENINQKRWVKSVELAKFNVKWPSMPPTLFQLFYTCPHCQLVMKHQWHLDRHLKICGKKKLARFECDCCGEKFQKKSRVRKHMQKHLNEKLFCCNKCGHGFSAKSGLLKHSRSKMIHRCAVCDVNFSCKLLLDRHRSEFHGNLFKCDKCNYKTKNSSNLMKHKGSHDKSFTCETCQKIFSTKYVLKDHQTQHRHGIYSSNPEVTFDCDECDKTFLTRHRLLAHVEGVHDTKQVKCKACNKIFRNSYLLRLHSRAHIKVECSICHNKISKFLLAKHSRTHSIENPFKCDLCDRSARGKIYIKQHIERKHLLGRLLSDSKCRDDFCDFELLDKLQLKYGTLATICEKKFECDKCNKFFITPRKMKEHKRTVHAEKKFACEICKKTFKTNSAMTKHKGSTHLKISCSICHKKVGKRRMKLHMKVHQHKNFECDRCDYKTQFKRNLEDHIKRRHRKGALSCNFGCKRNFAKFHQLFDHQKMHIGVKQWKCLACNYQATIEQTLFTHMSAKKHEIVIQ